MTIVRGLIIGMGLYYIVGIAIFQIGLKGPIENRMVSRIGNIPARVVYALIGMTGIVLVLIGLI